MNDKSEYELIKEEREYAKRYGKRDKTTNIIFLTIGMIVGILVVCLGFLHKVEFEKSTKGYQYIDGFFTNKILAPSEKNEKLYYLVYTYTVNNQDYTITTNYSTSMLPKKNSIKKIQYNPKQPEQAEFADAEDSKMVIAFGMIFVIIPLCEILDLLMDKKKKKYQIFKEIENGIILIVFGFGMLYFMAGTISITRIFSLYSGLSLIPPLFAYFFLLVGIIIIIQQLFFSKKKKGRKNKKS